jgi:hypothetical protein
MVVRPKIKGDDMAIPDNVKNPSLYKEAKAKARAKFDVYPSAYANAYMVKEYKKMGGQYKADGGPMIANNKKLKPIPKGNKGLPELPKKVRNQIGFMREGGKVSFVARGCGAIDPKRKKRTKMRG